MGSRKTDSIIQAYDQALDQLNKIQTEVCKVLASARKELLEGRRKAIHEELKKDQG